MKEISGLDNESNQLVDNQENDIKEIFSKVFSQSPLKNFIISFFFVFKKKSSYRQCIFFINFNDDVVLSNEMKVY